MKDGIYFEIYFVKNGIRHNVRNISCREGSEILLNSVVDSIGKIAGVEEAENQIKKEEIKFDIYDSSEREVVCVSNKDNKFFGCDENSLLLEVGKTYTVVNVIVHSWHTEIQLKEFPNNILFNSACFCEKGGVQE